MKCSVVKKRLSAYMDGELVNEQRLVVETHLRECETCQRELQALMEAWDLVGTLPEPELDFYFYKRLEARMAPGGEKRKSVWVDRVLIPASAVAAVILGIVVGSIVGRNGEWWAGELTVEEEMVGSLYLDSFDAFPNSSLGEAYFGLASQEGDMEDMNR